MSGLFGFNFSTLHVNHGRVAGTTLKVLLLSTLWLLHFMVIRRQIKQRQSVQRCAERLRLTGVRPNSDEIRIMSSAGLVARPMYDDCIG